MQYSTSFISTVVAGLALSPLVSGTVFLGLRTAADGSQSVVAWTNGAADVCDDFTTVLNSAGDPCGIPFTVDGGNGEYEAQGCGGDGLSLTDNGSFNSNCEAAQVTISCPDSVKIAQSYSCS